MGKKKPFAHLLRAKPGLTSLTQVSVFLLFFNGMSRELTHSVIDGYHHWVINNITTAFNVFNKILRQSQLAQFFI
jgi:hypothetical protein